MSSARILVDGLAYGVQNANRPWSVSNPGPDTLRFEVRPGDVWKYDSDWKERSEISGERLYAHDKDIDVNYEVMVEPGAPNTATGGAIDGNWLTLGQFHSADQYSSSLFAFELIGEKMAIRVGYRLPGGDYQAFYPFIDDENIDRGRYYHIEIRIAFRDDDGGFVEVWRDGQQIVDYRGPVGYGFGAYWKEGIYRHEASATIAVDFRDLAIDGDEGTTISGTSGRDKISADLALPGQPKLTDGGDVIYAYGSRDWVRAGGGEDVVFGGSGGDRINGRLGDDTLIGEAGKDVLRGGKGHDTFIFAQGAGHDRIVDFGSIDEIAFDRTVFKDFASVHAAMDRHDGGTEIDWDGGSVFIRDLRPQDFRIDDILFL